MELDQVIFLYFCRNGCICKTFGPVSCVSLISTSTLEEDWQSRQAGLALDEFGQLGRTSGKWEGLVGRRRWTKQGLVTDDSTRQPATYLLLCICNCICCALFQYRVLQLAVSYHHHWHRHRQGEEDPGSQRCNFQPSAHTDTNFQKVHTDYFYCCQHL